jgi:ketosteroid isomerase-like protein
VRLRNQHIRSNGIADVSDRDQEIIASVRRTCEAFSRGDFDAAIELAHPEIEFVPPGRQGAYRGADAVRAWMEPEAFEAQRIEPREFRIQGNTALVRQHNTARGAASGIELELETWAVWTLDDDGLVTRIESFLFHEEREALEAAGLRGAPNGDRP